MVTAEQNDSPYDVIVVGGGPTGSVAATDLAIRGIRTLVLERTDGSVPDARATATNVRTMELMRRYGIEEGLRNCGWPRDRALDVVYGPEVYEPEIVRMPWPAIDDAPPAAYSPTSCQRCPQRAMAEPDPRRHGPAAALGRPTLSGLVTCSPVTGAAAACGAYAVYDPVARTWSFCLAGHPPPLVVHPDGTLHSPELTVNPPLGAAEPPFDVHEVHLPDESLLVCCTDGLVESATRDTEEGLVQLRRTLAEEVSSTPYFDVDPPDDGRDLDGLCDHIVSALVPDREGTTDDAALLITRIRGTPAADVLSYDLPHDPRAAGQARAHVRDQLAHWDLPELAMTTGLLVSELVGNVVRHAQGPIRPRLLRSRSLICAVYDHSLTTPRIRRAGYTDEGGRGLHLVAALSRRWAPASSETASASGPSRTCPRGPDQPYL